MLVVLVHVHIHISIIYTFRSAYGVALYQAGPGARKLMVEVEEDAMGSKMLATQLLGKNEVQEDRCRQMICLALLKNFSLQVGG